MNMNIETSRHGNRVWTAGNSEGTLIVEIPLHIDYYSTVTTHDELVMVKFTQRNDRNCAETSSTLVPNTLLTLEKLRTENEVRYL